MKTAVMYGAGNIGRGFIGQVLHDSGYEVAFIDVNMEVVDALNARKAYTQLIVDEIRVRHCFDGATPELHDCVFHALGHGWTPDGVLALAACGDWGAFASRLMTGGMEASRSDSVDGQ